MASILRSSKFVRYIAGFARHVVINTPREFDGNFVNTTHCFCSLLPRALATQATIQNEQSLELSIKRLDQDVRRSGRISRRDIEDVLEEIRSTRSATSSQSLMVIRCCGNLVPEEMPEVRTQLVQEIWNTLLKLNVPMDISHYNALLRVYLENRHAFLPTEFLSELEAKGIEPNRVTYQRLITRYCQLGDIEGATRILEFMREKQLPVTENVFNSLIMGHCQTGDMESAQGIISVMAKAGLEPSADTYTTLLCGYAKIGDLETMHKIFTESEAKDVYLLDKDYLDIVYELAVNGHEQHIPVILNRVRKAFGYSQDAVNAIYRLINNGNDNAAVLILKSMPRGVLSDGSLKPTGAFLIRQMVKANRPLDKILEICDTFEKEHMYDKAFLLATETSLEMGNEKLAYPLLTELQTRGLQVRQHYFWPLIIAKSADPSGDGIVQVLCEMHKLNITPTAETIREYVMPNIKGKSSQIIAKLREANISVGSAASQLVHSLLQKHDMEEAAVIVSTVPAFYNPVLIRRPLCVAFYQTRDINSFITIIHHICENLDRRETIIQESEELESLDPNAVVGQIISNLTYNRKFPEVVEGVLNALVQEGLSITTIAATKIQDSLGEKLTPEVSNLLGKLTSGELTPVTLIKRPVYTPSNQMNIPQLERLIENLTAKRQETTGLKRQLLTLYCRSKEIVKIEELLKQLETENFVYTAGVYAQLMDVYSYHFNLEQTLDYYRKLKELDSNFALDDLKVIRVVSLLIKNNRFDEGLEFLNTQSRDRKLEESPFPYTASCWRILNALADEGKDKELDILFDALVKNEFITVSNVMLGPLIKVHLVNNDINKALEKFEWCCTQYKATPWKNELACKLIQQEDADKLQKLTDLSTSVHGEINSLYDLVFAFVECGRIRQARKILETPGLQVRAQRLNNACQRFQHEGMVKSLEGLKDATKDLNHIDRSDIYYQLLLSYIKQDDVDKAVGLWTQMQEEDMTPSEQFLSKLGNFMSAKNMNVPFALPKIVLPDKSDEETNRSSRNAIVIRPEWVLFRQAVKNGNVDEAIKCKSQLKDPLSVLDGSNYIEMLIKADKLNEATSVFIDMVNRSASPITRVFRFMLNKLSNSGDLETLNMITKKLNLQAKKILSFDNKFCNAHVVSGKSEEYLNILENEIDNARDSDLMTIAEKFPRGGIVGILENVPELIGKFENIALKYAARGVVSPMNVLWAHYFIIGEEEKANEIWKTHLQNKPRLMFQRILQKARETSDEVLVKNLLVHLKSSVVTEGALGNAHSCLLDILTVKNNTEEIVSCFEAAVKDTKLENLNRTALIRIRDVYEQIGKPFNYIIPAKSRRNQNPNHSDDDNLVLQKTTSLE